MIKVCYIIILLLEVVQSNCQPVVLNNIPHIDIKTIRKGHPRVMVSDFEPIRKDLAINPLRQNWLEKLKKDENPDAAALVYVLTGDKSYAEMSYIGCLKYSDADLTGGPHVFGRYIAYIGASYDWLHDHLSPEQKVSLLKKIKLCLTSYLVRQDKDCWHNMNHCMHGGVIIAAVAIADEESELAEKVINEAVNYLNMSWYKPDGVTPEGPHYMAWSSLVMISGLATLDTAFGEGFGLSDEKGLIGYGEFRLHGDAPRGGMAVKFGDCYANQSVYTPGQIFWLANKHNRPDFFQYAIDTDPFVADVGNYHGKVHAMLWYDPVKFKPDPNIYNTIPLEKSFESGQLAVMRSGWRDRDALFAGIKGTDDYHQANTFHRHSNTGTFFLQALGEEWAMDLGQESYLVKDYDAKPRKYYKLRAEGHNCNIINPALGVDNLGWDKCPIVLQGASLQEAFAVVEMTPDYKGIASSAKRGLKMFDGRRKVLVQDEIVSLDGKPMDSYWFMQTEAGIDIAPDRKSAILYRGGERMLVYMANAPKSARFTIMNSEPLVYTPISESKEGWNFGAKKLTIHTNTETKLNLSVVFVPLRNGEVPYCEPFTYIRLDEWHVSHQPESVLSDIKVNGQSIATFDPCNFTYECDANGDNNMTVTAIASDKQTSIKITQCPSVPGKTVIDVEQKGKKASQYVVWFLHKRPRILKCVTDDYSSWDESLSNYHVVAPLISAGKWLDYDLGKISTIGAASIGFDKPNSALPYQFRILVSDDGKSWTQVYAGQSRQIEGLEFGYPQVSEFQQVSGRFVRIQNMESAPAFTIEMLRFFVNAHEAKEYVNKAFPDVLNDIVFPSDQIKLSAGQTDKIAMEGKSIYTRRVDLSKANVTFESENPKVAIVSASGEVKGISAGKTTVRIMVSFGDIVLHKKRLVVVI